jgi:predicted ATP-grasp superfamily ATP-dependent carboligase
MRLFVSEYLTSGAWLAPFGDGSLAREGRAMLLAFLEDARAIDGVQAITTWDARLGAFPGDDDDSGLSRVEVHVSESAEHGLELFRRLAAECDTTLVISPEFDELLQSRRELVDAVGGSWLGSSAGAIALATDKLRLSSHLQRYGVPTIVTRALDVAAGESLSEYPSVVKPRDGAGSQWTYLVRVATEWASVREELIASNWKAGFVVQPYVAGAPLSASAIVGSDETVEVFSVGRQRLSDDGRFQYLGGEIPVGDVDQADVEHVVSAACHAIPGLSGYVGFDLIQPEESPDTLLIVDINPRLTTSYLGYRALANENLASRIIDPSASNESIRWRSGQVQFDCSGALTSLPLLLNTEH